MEQLKNFRHFCKVCKRRFACGRALGGHMKIHGAVAAQSNLFPPLNEELDGHHQQKLGYGAGDSEFKKSNDPMYALRPNRKRSWRFADGDYSVLVHAQHGYGSKCNNSLTTSRDRGKEFSSWRCHSDRPWNMEAGKEFWDCENNEQVLEKEVAGMPASGLQYTIPNLCSLQPRTKGKRSKRSRYVAQSQHHPNSEEEEEEAPCQHNEEEETAHFLVMLSNAEGLWGPARDAEFQEQGSATSQSMDIRLPIAEENDSELLDILCKKRSKFKDDGPSDKLKSQLVSKKSSYECKTCYKVFHSFQALGGHRASHNKVKGFSSGRINMQEEHKSLEEEIITAAHAAGEDDDDLSRADHHELLHHFPLPRDQVEKFSYNEDISDTSFRSGQSLGGHMGCHWMSYATSAMLPSLQQKQQQPPWRGRGELIDLNMPASVDDDSCIHAANVTLPSNLVDNFQTEADCVTIPPYIPPWWKHGLFSIQKDTCLFSNDGDADVKLENKITLFSGHDLSFRNMDPHRIQSMYQKHS
eukprot:Gb_30808 [translate_table: standard]